MEKQPIPSFTYASKTYCLLTKPGIIMGNVITTAGGFALASHGSFAFFTFLMTVIGISLVIGGACVFNNFIDRNHDQKMERTKNRAFAKGEVSTLKALAFASILGIGGTALLGVFTNYLTMGLAIFGFVVYVVLYSFSKYYSIHGTLIGSAAGAIPPVVGYCAASGVFDLGASLLFATVALWQMPHFFAIAIYRLEDYKSASIPVLPVKRGLHNTKIQMLVYIVLFGATSTLLFFFGYTGYLYLAVSIAVTLFWLALGFSGFKAKDDTKWARKMFAFSLVVIVALCSVIPFSS